MRRRAADRVDRLRHGLKWAVHLFSFPSSICRDIARKKSEIHENSRITTEKSKFEDSLEYTEFTKYQRGTASINLPP
jgi:hypothetical protein